jgi:hypothetical protein
MDRKQNQFIIDTVIPYCLTKGLKERIAYSFYPRFYSDPVEQVKTLKNVSSDLKHLKEDFKLFLTCLIEIDKQNPLVKEWQKALKLDILNV